MTSPNPRVPMPGGRDTNAHPTGPVPPSTASAANTPSPMTSPNARFTMPVSRYTSAYPTATSPYTPPAASPDSSTCSVTFTGGAYGCGSSMLVVMLLALGTGLG